MDNDTLLTESIKKKRKKLDRVANRIAYWNRHLLRKTLKKGRTRVVIEIPSSLKRTREEETYIVKQIRERILSNPENAGWGYEHTFATNVYFYYNIMRRNRMDRTNEAIMDLKNLIVDVEFIENESDIDKAIKAIKTVISKLEDNREG